jgi:hypothetical protein
VLVKIKAIFWCAVVSAIAVGGLVFVTEVVPKINGARSEHELDMLGNWNEKIPLWSILVDWTIAGTNSGPPFHPVKRPYTKRTLYVIGTPVTLHVDGPGIVECALIVDGKPVDGPKSGWMVVNCEIPKRR